MLDFGGSPVSVPLLHRCVPDRNNDQNVNVWISLVIILFEHFCSSHLEVGIGKHLNQPFILIYKISITRSRHPDVKCRKRQTRSEMWIHRNLSGKDRSSSHSIKTQFPLSGPSDQIHKKKSQFHEIRNNVMPLLTRLLSKNRPQLIEKRTHIIA